MTLMTITRAVEILRDLVGGDTKIEYEWTDEDSRVCRMTTTIDEHLVELYDIFGSADNTDCGLDDLTVGPTGIWVDDERGGRWLYNTCGKPEDN